MSLTVIDNFLHKDVYVTLRNIVINDQMNWNFNPGNVEVNKKSNDYVFTHLIFYNGIILSDKYEYLLKNIIWKLPNFAALNRAKFNLNTKCSNKIMPTGWHKDYEWNLDYSYTALLYLSTTDGPTEFYYDGKTKKVECIDNRVVIFPTETMHQGYTPCNSSARYALNINYFIQ